MTILAQPQSLVTAAGSSAALNVVADGPAPLTYRWLKNGGSLADGIKFSGTSSNVLTLANLATNDSGGFSVVVANQGGVITSSVATVTVLLPLKFTMHGSHDSRKIRRHTSRRQGFAQRKNRPPPLWNYMARPLTQTPKV